MLVGAASVKWLTYSYICTYFPARFCITFQDLYVDNCVAKQSNKIIIVCIRYTCINEDIIKNNSPSCISCNINKNSNSFEKKTSSGSMQYAAYYTIINSCRNNHVLDQEWQF